MAPLPEITRRQQALVDTCFEESLYETGVGILDQIRTTGAVPSRSHVQQLFYLSLYPPNAMVIVPKTTVVTKPTKRRGAAKSREAPQVVPPSQEAIDQALNVLYHFLNTNGSTTLLDAIPSCENQELKEEGDDNMNPLAYHATIITRARHCWELLSPEYVLSGSDVPVGQGKGKVGSNAWGVLGWLIEAFEKDAGVEGSSDLLADQLPKSSTGVKAVMDAPLDIVFAAFTEPLDGQRTELGRRLLNLLIGLTRATPPKLSADRLVSETSRRLEGVSSASYSALLSRITKFDFKLPLACSFITKHSDESLPSSEPASKRSGQPASRMKRGTTPVPATKPAIAPSQSVYSPERALAILCLRVRAQEALEEDEGGEELIVQSAEEQRLRFETMRVHLCGVINDRCANDQGWREAVVAWIQSGGADELGKRSGEGIGDSGELSEKMAAVAAGYADAWQRFVSS